MTEKLCECCGVRHASGRDDTGKEVCATCCPYGSMNKLKPERREGRTQLVGYAHKHGIVQSLTAGRAMDLDVLRRMVEEHRQKNAEATTADKERT